MLLATLEIVPHGDWTARYPIERIYIANVGGDKNKANYHVWVDEDPTDRTRERPEPHLTISKFKRNSGARELVRQILNKLYSKKTKESKRAKSRSIKAGAKSTKNS